MTQRHLRDTRVSMLRGSTLNGEGLHSGRMALLSDALLSAVFALIFSLSWSVLILHQIGANYSPAYLLLIQFLTIVLWWLSFRFPLPALTLAGGAAVSAGASVLLNAVRPGTFMQVVYNIAFQIFEQIRDSVLWSFAATQGGRAQPEHYTLFLSVLAATAAFLIVWKKPLPFLLLAVLLFPYFGASPESAKDPLNVLMLLTGLMVTAVVFSRYSRLNLGRRHPFSFPPLATIALLLAASFGLQSVLPQNILREPRLAEIMRQQQKRWGAPETVNYFEFSLRDAGYYPLTQDLGGPLELKHEPFMNVTGPARSMYLRGAVSDEYTGHAWIGQTMDPNYIFDNEARHGKQAEVFGYPRSLRGGEEWLDQLFTRAVLNIEPLQIPIQVIFNGGRPQRIESDEPEEEQIYYYNDGGQIYSGKEIPLSGYRVEGYIPRALPEETRQNILRNGVEQGVFTLRQRTVSPAYREALMAHDPQLFDIVYGERGSSSRDLLEGLFALRNYLATHYTYETNVSYPDPGQDFLNWFLREKSGYCVYFGTAMTLLAREMGLQARYVEGFIVPAVEDPAGSGNVARTVLSDSAHAWTEIYVEGLGWIPMDATPAEAQGAIRNERQEEENDEKDPAETQEVSATTPPTTAETAAPPPTTPPTEPSAASAQPSSLPSQSEPSNPQANNQKHAPMSPAVKLLLILLALLLLLILLVVLFLRSREKLWRRRHERERLIPLCLSDPRAAMTAIWEDLKHLYSLKGEHEFASNQTLLRRFGIMDKAVFGRRTEIGNRAFQAMEMLLYAERPLTLQQWEPILAYYEQVELRVKESMPKMKWRWYRWLFPGKSGRF